MHIKALETIKSDGYVLEAEDSISVPDDVAQRWIAAGWAEDPSGVVPTGERRVLDARVIPGSSAHKHAAKVA